MRTSVHDGLRLNLREGGDLGGIHWDESSSAIFGRGDDGLGLCGCLDHCLSLRLNHFRGYIRLLPPRSRGLKLRLQLRLELSLNLLLQRLLLGSRRLRCR